jgi:hypothetical protein
VFPVGVLGFDIGGVVPGESVQVTIDLPVTADSYWKLDGGSWSQYANASSSGDSLLLTLTDGGPGDADGIANGIISDPGAPAISARHDLRVSPHADRSEAVALAGATVTGRVAVFVPGTGADVRSVTFYVDGRWYSADWTAPFDLGGTKPDGSATLLPSRLLPDGPHTISARVLLADGTIEVQEATFTTSNPRPPTRALMVSGASDRSNPRTLQGAVVTGSAAVFVPDEADLALVTFYVDKSEPRGLPYSLDVKAPFDLGGTRSNGQANLVRLPRGKHTITAVLVFRDGYVDVITATYTQK